MGEPLTAAEAEFLSVHHENRGAYVQEQDRAQVGRSKLNL